VAWYTYGECFVVAGIWHVDGRGGAGIDLLIPLLWLVGYLPH
jgi:hypothetical protein